jgi:hypothetical protein
MSLSMPGSYFRLRRLERGGRIYRYVGVRYFKALMTSRTYRRLNPHFNFRPASVTPRDLMKMMQDAEAAHAVVFGLMLLCSAAALVAGSSYAAAWLMVFNIIGNAYPVMLQRYNRGRVDRIFEPGNTRT